MTDEEIKGKASNLSSSNSIDNFTIDTFLEIMPQFSKKEKKLDKNGKEIEIISPIINENILNMFIKQAINSIQSGRWFEYTLYYRCLYVAHYITLYLQNYREHSNSIKDVAASGTPKGLLSSITLGDSSMSFDNSIFTNSNIDWGDLGSTTYGQQIIAKAKIIGMGGSVIL